MKCSADGCERSSMYKSLCLCQKHYFRLRRTGTVAKREQSRAKKITTPNGYVRVWDKDHPLACQRGYVFEHRHAMWSVVGASVGNCQLCGKAESWETCHIDHIDNDRKNNNISNLRVLCRGCNVKRGFTVYSYKNRGEVGLIEIDGVIDTPAGWSRRNDVNVTGATIVRRIKSGQSPREAVYGSKKTHNGNTRTKALHSRRPQSD